MSDREVATLPWCKWCIEFAGPVIQLKVGGVLHRWEYRGRKRKELWTRCGYQVRMVTAEDVLERGSYAH